ncbi:Protein-lysine N-methyltransferase EFM6 [Yarrowia sp. C11]|nr:Protein-lysine N-methyltransferase EFM6 [Yarrowia sp. E02]KAG5369421.1 Protein-lysine N-methyltransferase EFM6 [Yarrowia sp. C11]
MEILQIETEVLPAAVVDVPERLNLGRSNLNFDGLLSGEGLKIEEDGGAAGCGGKLWPAGEMLAYYLLRKGIQNYPRVLEIGSGTGLTGLAIALSESAPENLKVWVTDQENMIPLMNQNIELNNLQDKVVAEVLDWGEELPSFLEGQPVDLVLAADCVYLESAFPLLEKTLIDLSNKDTKILMSYKKRRKADSRFFKSVKKHFTIVEISDFEEHARFKKDGVTLMELQKKTK